MISHGKSSFPTFFKVDVQAKRRACHENFCPPEIFYPRSKYFRNFLSVPEIFYPRSKLWNAVAAMACNSCQNEKKITLRIYFYFIFYYLFIIFNSGLKEREKFRINRVINRDNTHRDATYGLVPPNVNRGKYVRCTQSSYYEQHPRFRLPRLYDLHFLLLRDFLFISHTGLRDDR